MNNEKRVHSSIYDEKCYAMRYGFFHSLNRNLKFSIVNPSVFSTQS